MILSVSRRTDIPALYGDWFFNRLKEGYVLVRNPVNKLQVSRIELNPEAVDCIVFWTKNPASFINRLHLLKNYNYYFQFTLNPYDGSIERNLPDKESLLKIFIELSKVVGKEKIIWRYDPIILNDRLNIEYHRKAFETMASKLHGYTEKCVISFLDLYSKTEKKMKDINEIKETEMRIVAESFSKTTEKLDIKLTTCAEKIDLSYLGIEHGKCIDTDLISKLIGTGFKSRKDPFQREQCGCISSVDIGAYNTCPNGCLYCYANFDDYQVVKNRSRHDPASPMLIGNIEPEDLITVRRTDRISNRQLRIFE